MKLKRKTYHKIIGALILIAFAVLLGYVLNGNKSIPVNTQGNADYFVNVLWVADGDSFTGQTTDSLEVDFRIFGIDAPEKGQPYSNESRKLLVSLINKKKIGVVSEGYDRYGRRVVTVYDANGKNIGAEMIRRGLAWHFVRYDSSPEYQQLENDARARKIGFWADDAPVPPWLYR